MYTETDDVIGTVTLFLYTCIYISSSFRVSSFRPFAFLPVVISLLFRYIIYVPMNYIVFWPGVFTFLLYFFGIFSFFYCCLWLLLFCFVFGGGGGGGRLLFWFVSGIYRYPWRYLRNKYDRTERHKATTILKGPNKSVN